MFWSFVNSKTKLKSDIPHPFKGTGYLLYFGGLFMQV